MYDNLVLLITLPELMFAWCVGAAYYCQAQYRSNDEDVDHLHQREGWVVCSAVSLFLGAIAYRLWAQLAYGFSSFPFARWYGVTLAAMVVGSAVAGSLLGRMDEPLRSHLRRARYR